MESSVRDGKSSDSQQVPHQPILQASAKPPSRRTRQKKQTASPNPVSDPAPDPSASRRLPGRRSSANDPTPSLPVAARAQADHTQPPPQDYSRFPAARATAIQPYTPIPYMMNPPYPINPSPFAQHHATPPAYPAPAGMNGASGPGMAAHPPPYYHVHPTPYAPAHHAFAPYHPPVQQMMVYTPARPAQALPEQSQPANPSPAPISTAPVSVGKRKRKADGARDKGPADKDSDQEGPSPSDVQAKQPPPTTPSTPTDSKKRTKTQRACDSCRSRKIRCDILPDSEPQLCQHCKQYGFECTFFLPITETRFKKKKLEEEAAAEKEKEKSDARRTTTSPQADPSDRRVYGVEHAESLVLPTDPPIGPTNPVHLLHSQATISSRIYESYDKRHHHTWEMSKNGDGLISVQNVAVEDKQTPHLKPVDLHIESEVIQDLVNAYFKEIAPILPIITETEFLATSSQQPILLYSICLVTAARRGVSQSVFDSIRYIVNSIIKAEDVLSTASIANVQSLLILSMVADSHSQNVPDALSALWIRLGTAIRMAQDLGLHRAESVKQNIELRRRLWSACVICDRWASLTYGHPYMIDVQDCDARLPSSGDPDDLYMDELVRLSVILGRVLKTIYSPSGLTLTTDEMLYALQGDLEAWKDNLPESLKYRGPDTPRNAGGKMQYLLNICLRDTAEIISLLYKATQGPPLPLDKPPLLNPTGGVKGRQPVSGLEYKKDPSRPGGGVFVAHGEARKADYGLPEGTIITSSDEESDSQPKAGSSSLVNIRPLRSGNEGALGGANVNPALNSVASQSPSTVQVLKVLDSPQASGMLEQFAMADVGLLEGFPGWMSDSGQWASFFARLNPDVPDDGVTGHRAEQEAGVSVHQNTGVSRQAGPQETPARQE
ncbi:hypothetical protein ID866_3244 [Astraeus odoratus]|nr:hypothetical protein ID866_3244 [Astraeus odoratus]